MKIPCNLHENKEFIGELEDLGMQRKIYERIHNVTRANEIERDITIKIKNKCKGMQDVFVKK